MVSLRHDYEEVESIEAIQNDLIVELFDASCKGTVLYKHLRRAYLLGREKKEAD